MVEIEKEGEARIKYYLTVPFICETCKLYLQIKDIKPTGYPNNGHCDSDIVTLSHWNRCETYIEGRNWNVTKSIAIKHRTIRKYGIRIKTFLLKLETFVSGNNSSSKATKIADVKVRL